MSAKQSTPAEQLALAKKTQLSPGVYLTKVSDGELVLFLVSAELPIPKRSMYANWVDATREGKDISLAFGQLAPSTAILSAVFLVSMSPGNIAKALYSKGNPTFVSDLAKRIGGNTIEERNVAFPQHGERVVFDRASALDIAYANGAAELRFYAVSPRAIHELKAGALKKAGKGAVAAVVKIDMSTEHLGFLCGKLETLISKDDMPAY